MPLIKNPLESLFNNSKIISSYLSTHSIPVLGIPLKRTLNLEDEARPAELKSCHPWGECKFTLQMRKGGLVRIHDSILMAESKYKCLLISEHTTGELQRKISQGL